jgi:hypothetical protein
MHSHIGASALQVSSQGVTIVCMDNNDNTTATTHNNNWNGQRVFMIFIVQQNSLKTSQSLYVISTMSNGMF